MSEEPETQRLQDLIPKNLDDIIRANRDKCRLAFATDDELHALECDLPGKAARQVRHTLTDWNILMIHVFVDGSMQSIPKLLGSVQETGQCWITSTVTGIDSRAGLVQKKNSVYGDLVP